MSSINIAGDSSGSIILTVPSVAGTNTATLPASTGTVMVSGNMPAFSAYANAIQSFTGGTNTKIQFNTKEFDTANCYDATTNYRFTPNVAGYYNFIANYRINVSGQTEVGLSFYKNGSLSKAGSDLNTGAIQLNATALIYMNGTTDYVECYIYLQNNQTSASVSQANSYFQATMVRAS